MNRITVFLLLSALPLACEPPTANENLSVTIMTFNVENLFDNKDDPGKNDHTFFALSDKQSDEHKAACAEIEVERWRDQCLFWDWSDSAVERKLSVVAEAILQVDNGQGPDIIALQEVENIGILERLRTEYLSDAGYLPAMLIEGDDLRGIDVAFLTRLKLANEPVLHYADFTAFANERIADTRGILQANFFLPDGSILTGFSVHFPAPFHPVEMRDIAYDHLNKLKSALPRDRAVFAAGDFNTTSREDREKHMLDRHVRPHWIIAHELGCGSCKGTQYYGPTNEWSFLDMILWSPAEARGAKATWQIRANSVRVANKVPEQVSEDGTPARFSLPAGSGVSDHWPLVISIETK